MNRMGALANVEKNAPCCLSTGAVGVHAARDHEGVLAVAEKIVGECWSQIRAQLDLTQGK